MFLNKSVPKICSKFTGKHPGRSVISIKLLCDFVKITLWHGCFPVNLLHIFRIPFPKTLLDGCLIKYLMSNSKIISWKINNCREISALLLKLFLHTHRLFCFSFLYLYVDTITAKRSKEILTT